VISSIYEYDIEIMPKKVPTVSLGEDDDTKSS
jgi:hypothetical protein